ncbi:MAG: sulfite exporter TauE/SafE family protein, partial [Acidobacteriota bacterium]
LYLMGAIPLILALGAFDVMGKQELVSSSVATIPLLLGVLIGQALRTRFNENAFRRGLLVMLLLAGLALVRRALV